MKFWIQDVHKNTFKNKKNFILFASYLFTHITFRDVFYKNQHDQCIEGLYSLYEYINIVYSVRLFSNVNLYPSLLDQSR